MLVTVIIPTYNRAEFLERAVASIVRQESTALFDILIIDDGSTDQTLEVCARLKALHPNLRVLRQENKGVAAARNLGLFNLLPETDIVTFLDSDDVLAPGRFSLDLPHLEADLALDMTYGRLLVVSDIDADTLEPSAGSVLQNLRIVQLSSGLYRRSLIERTGYFSEDLLLAEDTDFLTRIFEEGVNYLLTDSLTFYYVRHQGNITNDRVSQNRYNARAMLRAIKRRRDDPVRAGVTLPTMDSLVLPAIPSSLSEKKDN